MYWDGTNGHGVVLVRAKKNHLMLVSVLKVVKEHDYLPVKIAYENKTYWVHPAHLVTCPGGESKLTHADGDVCSVRLGGQRFCYAGAFRNPGLGEWFLHPVTGTIVKASAYMPQYVAWILRPAPAKHRFAVGDKVLWDGKLSNGDVIMPPNTPATVIFVHKPDWTLDYRVEFDRDGKRDWFPVCANQLSPMPVGPRIVVYPIKPDGTIDRYEFTGEPDWPRIVRETLDNGYAVVVVRDDRGIEISWHQAVSKYVCLTRGGFSGGKHNWWAIHAGEGICGAYIEKEDIEIIRRHVMERNQPEEPKFKVGDWAVGSAGVPYKLQADYAEWANGPALSLGLRLATWRDFIIERNGHRLLAVEANKGGYASIFVDDNVEYPLCDVAYTESATCDVGFYGRGKTICDILNLPLCPRELLDTE